MARPKGQPKLGGRQKGTPNKLTVKVKEAILQAFELAGGVDYLQNVAREDPRTFCTLLGKVLPTELSGPDGGAIQVSSIVINPVKKA